MSAPCSALPAAQAAKRLPDPSMGRHLLAGGSPTQGAAPTMVGHKAHQLSAGRGLSSSHPSYPQPPLAKNTAWARDVNLMRLPWQRASSEGLLVGREAPRPGRAARWDARGSQVPGCFLTGIHKNLWAFSSASCSQRGGLCSVFNGQTCIYFCHEDKYLLVSLN